MSCPPKVRRTLLIYNHCLIGSSETHDSVGKEMFIRAGSMSLKLQRGGELERIPQM